MTQDLSAWLLEQIYADRVIAQDALKDWVDGEDGDEMADQPNSILVGAHLVRWSPKRVLAECDVKRRIIELHHPFHVTTKNDGLNWDYKRCVICEPQDRELGPNESYWPCPTLQLLALPYADREGYRDEWRP
jgi:hypothetical protein